MSQIELLEVCKTFKVAERPEGRLGILRGAFVRTTRHVKALQSVSFNIDEGELVGYIGPNGAGKSTTVKVMSGILTPDSGKCVIMNRVPWKERVAHVSRIGVVFGQRSQLWWDLPVKDSYDLLKSIYNLSGQEYAKRLEELVMVLDLKALLKTPVRQLSLGQRMRCEIAAALLHRPDILFLDEPTIGLDAVSKIALRDFLKKENKEKGITMILTTHDMDDVESLCSKVMVIGHGRLLFSGRLKELKKTYAPFKRIRATLQFPCPPFPIEGIEKLEIEDRIWTVLFDPEKTTAPILVEALAKNLPLRDIAIEDENIDHIIASMYREMGL